MPRALEHEVGAGGPEVNSSMKKVMKPSMEKEIKEVMVRSPRAPPKGALGHQLRAMVHAAQQEKELEEQPEHDAAEARDEEELVEEVQEPSGSKLVPAGTPKARSRHAEPW